MSQRLPETAAPPVLGRDGAAVLAVTSAVVVMVFLDATIVNVAFETISRDLHAGASPLASVLSAYSLAFAAMLIPAGRLANLAFPRLRPRRPDTPTARSLPPRLASSHHRPA